MTSSHNIEETMHTETQGVTSLGFLTLKGNGLMKYLDGIVVLILAVILMFAKVMTYIVALAIAVVSGMVGAIIVGVTAVAVLFYATLDYYYKKWRT